MGEPKKLMVFELMGEAFGLMFKRRMAIVFFSLILVIAYLKGAEWIATFLAKLVFAGSPASSTFVAISQFVPMLIVVVITSFVTSVLIQVATAITNGEQISVFAFLRKALAKLPVVFCLALIGYFAIFAGLVLLVIPGLLAIAVYILFMPIVFTEDRGFDTVKRAIEITEGYRWPIIGGWLIVLLTMGLFVGGSIYVAAQVTLVDPRGFSSLPSYKILSAGIVYFANTVLYSYSASFSVLIYRRLKAIKEGPTDSISEVFS